MTYQELFNDLPHIPAADHIFMLCETAVIDYSKEIKQPTDIANQISLITADFLLFKRIPSDRVRLIIFLYREGFRRMSQELFVPSPSVADEHRIRLGNEHYIVLPGGTVLDIQDGIKQLPSSEADKFVTMEEISYWNLYKIHKESAARREDSRTKS
jgi:hypothetical protein